MINMIQTYVNVSDFCLVCMESSVLQTLELQTSDLGAGFLEANSHGCSCHGTLAT